MHRHKHRRQGVGGRGALQPQRWKYSRKIDHNQAEIDLKSGKIFVNNGYCIGPHPKCYLPLRLWLSSPHFYSLAVPLYLWKNRLVPSKCKSEGSWYGQSPKGREKCTVYAQGRGELWANTRKNGHGTNWGQLTRFTSFTPLIYSKGKQIKLCLLVIFQWARESLDLHWLLQSMHHTTLT